MKKKVSFKKMNPMYIGNKKKQKKRGGKPCLKN